MKMNLGLGLHLVYIVVYHGLLCDERDFIVSTLERWLVVGLKFSNMWLSFWVAVMCGLLMTSLVVGFCFGQRRGCGFPLPTHFFFHLNHRPFSLTSFFLNLAFKIKNPKTLFFFYDFKVTTNFSYLLPLTTMLRFGFLSSLPMTLTFILLFQSLNFSLLAQNSLIFFFKNHLKQTTII